MSNFAQKHIFYRVLEKKKLKSNYFNQISTLLPPITCHMVKWYKSSNPSICSWRIGIRNHRFKPEKKLIKKL